MKSKKQKQTKFHESDLAFLIKSALYLLLGTVWLSWGGHRWLPIGVVVGFGLSKIEVLRINRKIEYALLVVGGLLGLFGLGLTIYF